jgi:hypothetical protein
MSTASQAAPVDHRPTGWRRSSRSYLGNDCVEVLTRRNSLQVRDSKARYGPELQFCLDAWMAFLKVLRAE